MRENPAVVTFEAKEDHSRKPFKSFYFGVNKTSSFLYEKVWSQEIRGTPMYKLLRSLKCQLKKLNRKDFSDVDSIFLLRNESSIFLFLWKKSLKVLNLKESLPEYKCQSIRFETPTSVEILYKEVAEPYSVKESSNPKAGNSPKVNHKAN